MSETGKEQMDKKFDNPELNEQELRKEWMQEARAMTAEKLPAFIDKLINRTHDYGTVCRAMAAAGVAGAYAIEHSKVGGITGFQAGCVMWDLITGWDSGKEDKPLKLVEYENMLYPQYADSFHEISKDAWEFLQKKARDNLADEGRASPTIREHWESIVNGRVPFGYTVRDE